MGFVANQACCVCGGGIRPNLSTNTTTTGSPTLPPTSNVVPIDAPSDVPSVIPSDAPSIAPSDVPSDAPSDVPNVIPSDVPSIVRSDVPSDAPSSIMSVQPTVQNCYDVPGWFAYNNPKFDCAWFASPVNNFPSDDYYDDSDTRCVMFGGADSTSGGYTALTACCTCGKFRFVGMRALTIMEVACVAFYYYYPKKLTSHCRIVRFSRRWSFRYVIIDF